MQQKGSFSMPGKRR